MSADTEDSEPRRRTCCCCCYQWECCEKYFPEWSDDRVKIWRHFAVNVFIMIIIAGLVEIGVITLYEYVFETGSTITYNTIIVMFVFFSGVVWILLVYVKWQHPMYSWTVKIAVVVIYAAVGIYLIITDLIGQSGIFETDSTCYDVWTIVHFLAGPFFAILLPFWWTTLVVTLWEGVEIYTTGLGDEEVPCNRVVDILVAIIGWFIIVLLFIRKFIPWISSKNAYDEWYEVNGRKYEGYDTAMVGGGSSESENTDTDHEQEMI